MKPKGIIARLIYEFRQSQCYPMWWRSYRFWRWLGQDNKPNPVYRWKWRNA